MNIKKALLRIDEARIILNCSRDHVYDLLSTGRLKAHNPKGTPGTRGTQIVAASLEEHLAAGTIPVDKWNE